MDNGQISSPAAPSPSPRLCAAAAFVPRGSLLVDVGTDHALLPAHLVLQGVITRALAVDIRHGPLEAAGRTLSRLGLSDKIELRLSDGLRDVSPEEAEAIVIAGMGGETIRDILSAAPWCREGGSTLILQPMSRQEELRRYLWDEGFSVTDESLARERGRIYCVIRACGAGPKPENAPEPARLYVGAPLLERRDPLLPEYITQTAARLIKERNGLISSRVSTGERLAFLNAALDGLSKMREEL